MTSARPMSNAATSSRLRGAGSYSKGGRANLNLSSQAQMGASNIMSGMIKVNQWTSNQQARPGTQGGMKGDPHLSLNSSTVVLNSSQAIQQPPNAIYHSEADFATTDNFTDNQTNNVFKQRLTAAQTR